MQNRRGWWYLATIVVGLALLLGPEIVCYAEDLPVYLKDRGTGVPSSMFGTYIRQGEFIVYPYFEYYHDNNAEYAPEELGYGLDQDFRGRFRGCEYLLFLGYGLTDRFAVELEAALYMDASLETALEDPTGIPDKITDSGLGDVEAQIRMRWLDETANRPEVFSYFETVFPFGDDNSLIGTADWEFVFGAGLIKGFSFGTFTLRAAVEYDEAESGFAQGEVAVEYLKQLSSRWRALLAIEGTEDEVEFITEAQLRLSDNCVAKLNNAFGITSKAPDWAPEIGLMFSF